jgi:hypothetical protein
VVAWHAAPAAAGAVFTLAVATVGCGRQRDEIAEFRSLLADLPGVERVDASSRSANDLILDAEATVQLSADAAETEIADVLSAIPDAVEASGLEGLSDVTVVAPDHPNVEIRVAADGRADRGQTAAEAGDAAALMRVANETFSITPSDAAAGSRNEPITVSIRYPNGAIWVRASADGAPQGVLDLAEPVVRATPQSWSWRVEFKDLLILEPQMTFATVRDMTVERLDRWRALAGTKALLHNADQERLNVFDGTGALQPTCFVSAQLSVIADDSGAPSADLDDLRPYLHAQVDTVATMPTGTRYEVTTSDGTPLVTVTVGGRPGPDPLGLGWGPPLQEHLDARSTHATPDDGCDG